MSTWYERLSVLDASFLAFEGENSPMHIGAVAIFEAGPLATAYGGVDLQRIRMHVAAHLPKVPRYRQRLAYIPLENRPVWVDDDQFDLTYHVRHISLPRPGTDAQLREVCALLSERRLDRAKPLWEFWVIEGLTGGRFALAMKAHHCMVDGLGAAELLATLLCPTPDAGIEASATWEPRPAPDTVELLRDEIARRTEVANQLVRWFRGDDSGSAAGEPAWGGRLQAVWDLLRGGVHRAAATPLNQQLGPHRRLHWATCDLQALKDVRTQVGGTINDVVLSVVGGAVRKFFAARNFPVDGVDFRAAVPVNRRAEAERCAMGNRVSAWLVSLPIHESCAVRRVQAVRDVSLYCKETQQAVASETLLQAAEWTSTNVLNLGARLLPHMQPFNLIVTNVPGPQFPLYLLGARMEAIYPQVPLFENQSLGIALFSYDGKLFWGFNADWDALPDLDEFVRAAETVLRDLERAAQRQRNAGLAPRPARARRRAINGGLREGVPAGRRRRAEQLRKAEEKSTLTGDAELRV
jgi:diacylglycerol O-acyltransferase